MKHIIIDCDPGHDDAIALLLALHARELDILGVTTVAGNTGIVNATRNARRILDFAGATDIPVYAGCKKSLMQPLHQEDAAHIHGADGLGGVQLPEAVTPVESEHAVAYLIRTLREAEAPVILVPTGPMTNIAQMLVQAPDVREKIEKIVAMGGAVYGPGNANSAAEFNIYTDPEAAKIVLASGCEVYLVTLDVTMRALFTPEDTQELRAQGDAVSVTVATLLDHYAAAYGENYGVLGCPIHDALCVGTLIDEALVTWEHTYVDVSVHDELTRGETVADLFGRSGRAPNCHIAVTVDDRRFAQTLKSHMKLDYVKQTKSEACKKTF